MNKQPSKFRKNVLVKKVVVTCLFFSLLLPLHVASALTISPARVELSADPGSMINGKVLLINEQEQAKTFYSSAENFEASGETGAPSFVAGSRGLASWVDLPASITLEPGEQREITYSINIPENADPGGHFAAIFWGSNPPETDNAGSSVSVGAKIGSLILLRVSGEIEEGGGILEFGTENDKKFFTSLPISFTYRFQNDGDDRIRPEGEITILNTFRIPTERIDANPTEGNILPVSIRQFTTTWGNTNNNAIESRGFFESVGHQTRNFAFGLYTAKVNLVYGSSNELTDGDSYTFFVFPWQLLLVVLLAILLILFIWKALIRRYREKLLNEMRSELEKTMK